MAVIRLDDEVPGGVALMKIDVEGHEAAVLEGADRLQRTGRPALVVEANDPAALTDRLSPFGYHWVKCDPERRRLDLCSKSKWSPA